MSFETVHEKTVLARNRCDALMRELQALMDAATDTGMNGLADKFGTIYNVVHTIRVLCDQANTANVVVALGNGSEEPGA